MTQLSMGSNIELSATWIRASLRWSAGPGIPDIDASALLLAENGEVASDVDFVFYNQPEHYTGALRMAGKTAPPQASDQVDIELSRIPAAVSRIVLAASVDGGTFGQVPELHMVLLDLNSGQPIAQFPMRADTETAFVSAEIYRRGDGWKFRAIGQGYASGLAGLANDFGIDTGESDDAGASEQAPPAMDPPPVLPPPPPTAPPPVAPAPVAPPPVAPAPVAPPPVAPPPTAPPPVEPPPTAPPPVEPPPTAPPPVEPAPIDLPPAAPAPVAPAPVLDLTPPAPPTPDPTMQPPPAPPAPDPTLQAPAPTPDLAPPPVQPDPTLQAAVPAPQPPAPSALPDSAAPATPAPPSGEVISLRKDERADLQHSSGAPLSRVVFSLGWTPADGKSEIDLDASVIAFDAAGQKLAIVWYMHLNEFYGALQHTGDNRKGGYGDVEQVLVDLVRMPPNVESLIFTINSFRGHTFTDIAWAYCAVQNADDGEVLVRFDLSDTQPSTAILMAELRRSGTGMWRVRAIGEYHDYRTVKKLVPSAARQVHLGR